MTTVKPGGSRKSAATANPTGPKPAPKVLKKALGEVDSRFGLAGYLKRSMNKVFPDHWSFMLGEIALYSFIVLLLSGTFLTFFFRPGTNIVTYPTTGNYVPLRGLPMTEAFESTLRISFDIRGGLLIRQIHHWAALLFMAAIVAHCCRIFFTGAFRKPRETNWLIGVGLVTLGLLEGFAGYSLPDDLLSGTGLRIAYGIVESIPIVGTYLGSFVFGGQFPGPDFIPRLFTIHILLVPGILLALITAHLLLMWYQKHTQWPGPHRTNDERRRRALLSRVHGEDRRLLLRRFCCHRRACRHSCRSTRCGCTGRTTLRRSVPARSRTSTSVGSRARCA